MPRSRWERIEERALSLIHILRFYNFKEPKSRKKKWELSIPDMFRQRWEYLCFGFLAWSGRKIQQPPLKQKDSIHARKLGFRVIFLTNPSQCLPIKQNFGKEFRLIH
ncbi:hypothetical protein V6Z12_D02G166900 [Gossypium hirsutum]